MSAYSIASRGLAGRKIPQGVLAAINTLLFGSGEQGAWYDPADLSTLFQDTAGTTPVTAVEQAVALMLDKSGRGNHATQATSTKRPRYSRRVNLHGFNTSTFSDAMLLKNGNGLTPVVTSNYATAPDGTNTATRLQLNSVDTSGSAYSIVGAYASSIQVAGLYRTKIWMRATTGTATVGLVGAGTVLTFQSLTTAWKQVSLLEVGVAGSLWSLRISSGAAHVTAGPQDILVWQPSLTLETDAHLPYQWVNTATDYDADPAKFPGYLRFDGVDDAMQTGNIDFTGTDKMTVWAGITKLSDAGRASILELSAGATNLIRIEAPSFAGSPNYFFGSVGSAQSSVTASGIAAPNTSVLTGVGDIAGDVSILRVNSMQAGSSAIDQGAGNYSIAPLYIGARAGTSLFFNGRIYQLIVRGAQSSLSQIEAAELHTRRRMMLP